MSWYLGADHTYTRYLHSSVTVNLWLWFAESSSQYGSHSIRICLIALEWLHIFCLRNLDSKWNPLIIISSPNLTQPHIGIGRCHAGHLYYSGWWSSLQLCGVVWYCLEVTHLSVTSGHMWTRLVHDIRCSVPKRILFGWLRRKATKSSTEVSRRIDLAFWLRGSSSFRLDNALFEGWQWG